MVASVLGGHSRDLVLSLLGLGSLGPHVLVGSAGAACRLLRSQCLLKISVSAEAAFTAGYGTCEPSDDGLSEVNSANRRTLSH